MAPSQVVLEQSQQEPRRKKAFQGGSQSVKVEEKTENDQLLHKQGSHEGVLKTCLVVLIPKNRVRGVKVFLEANHWLDKANRISPVVQSESVEKSVMFGASRSVQQHEPG